MSWLFDVGKYYGNLYICGGVCVVVGYGGGVGGVGM